MFTPGYVEPPLPMVASNGPWGLMAHALANASTAPSSRAWDSGNLAVYHPIIVPCMTIVRRVFWLNGATTTGGATVEAGLYADGGYKPGAKLVSGAATQGTASQVQFVDVTDTSVPPGAYWLALTASTATNTTFFGLAIYANMDAAVRFEQASANPLPATATPVESTTATFYIFGFSTTTIT